MLGISQCSMVVLTLLYGRPAKPIENHDVIRQWYHTMCFTYDYCE